MSIDLLLARFRHQPRVAFSCDGIFLAKLITETISQPPR